VSLVYAGTTPERAALTLSTIREELFRVGDTLTEEELERAKINLKSSLFLSQDSSQARAVSNGADWWLSKRIRSPEEIEAAVNGVTVEAVRDYFRTFPSTEATLLVLGREPL
jgi:predicted Zn-dependent peptidase